MANVNPTAYTDSDPEEEYFPTPLPTPAVALLFVISWTIFSLFYRM